MHKLRAQLKAAGTMPLGLIAAKLLRRAGIRTAAVRRAEVLGNPQAHIPDRMGRLYVDFTARAEAAGWQPIDFAGARVLEVGCGPLAGLAPYVVPAGAAAYLGVDPGADPRLLRHRKTIRRYLKPALNATAPLTSQPDADTDIEAFFSKVTLFTGGLGEIESSDPPFDAAVSISCLEHINGLEAALRALGRVLSPTARQLHLVNFSNHLDKAAPFKHLYDLAPKEHHRRYGRHINLMRPDEVLAAFTAAGFDAKLVPVDVRPDALPADLDPWWRDRYSPEELAVRTALVVC